MIGIYDKNHAPLFQDAQISKVQVRETSKTMEHPIESGTVITDYKVINPVSIVLNIYLTKKNYNSVYQSLLTNFKKSTLLLIQTNARIYKDMIIADMPHSETPEHFESIILSLNLKQVFTVKPIVTLITKAKHAKHTPTTKRGVIQPKKSSVLAEWFKWN